MKPEYNSGYVYLFECLNFKNQYKVGYSKTPEKRASGFTSAGVKIKILKTIKSDRARDIESEIHNIMHRHSHWTILQRICNSKTARKYNDLAPLLYKYSTPSHMSCEWFYLKPKRVLQILELFEKNEWGVVV